MRKLKRLLAYIYDLPNAYRVLYIMDKAGVDISKVERQGFEDLNYWNIRTKWYVTEEQAKDLQNICLHKRQYKKRSRILSRLIFKRYRENCRPLPSWF